MELIQTSYLHDQATGAFQIRRQQFRERHGWELSVNAKGEERDEYDDARSLYVNAVEDEDIIVTCRLRHVCHGTMAEDHFSDLFGLSGEEWAGFGNRHELTRFCKAPEVGRKQCCHALSLIRDTLKYEQLATGHQGYVAVVYAPIARLLRMNGIPFEVAATAPIDDRPAHLLLIDFREQVDRVALPEAA